MDRNSVGILCRSCYIVGILLIVFMAQNDIVLFFV